MGQEVATWSSPTYLLLDLEFRLIARVTGINCTRCSQVLDISERVGYEAVGTH